MPGKLAALVRAKHPGAYDDMDDAALESAVLAKYPQYADLTKDTPASQHAAVAPADSSSLSLSALQKGLPLAEEGATAFATSPNVAPAAAKIGRFVGGVAAPVSGAMYGGPAGGVIGALESAKGAWAGGKTGWFAGKLAQGMAMPVAKGLSALAPYAQTLGTLSGAQGMGDLAQMADPTRKDIGFLGMSMHHQPMAGEQPPLVNALLEALRRKLGR